MNTSRSTKRKIKHLSVCLLYFFCSTICASEDSTSAKPWRLFDPEKFSNSGFDLVGSWTQFYHQSLTDDDTEKNSFGGRLDFKMVSQLADSGFYFSLNGAHIFGDDPNNNGDGTVLPLNTALGFPRLSGRDSDFTQVALTFIGQSGHKVTLGKIDMVDLLSQSPIIGGGGKSGFQNLAFAAPPSGLVSPAILGGMATLNLQKSKLTLGVFDPGDATDIELNESFKKVAALASYSFVTGLNQRPTSHSISVKFNNVKGLDLNRLPDLGLPPEAAVVLGSKTGAWNIAYSFQKHLWQDPNTKHNGWGVFGQIGRSDGNPTPIKWSGYLGIGGNTKFPNRPQDKWGLGYFYLDVSDVLIAGLNGIAADTGEEALFLEDETGIEAFYEFQLNSNLALSANLQLINPHEKQKDHASNVGLRMYYTF